MHFLTNIADDALLAFQSKKVMLVKDENNSIFEVMNIEEGKIRLCNVEKVGADRLMVAMAIETVPCNQYVIRVLKVQLEDEKE